MKTAEEILTSKFEGLESKIPSPLHEVQRALIISAMEEYAKQYKDKYKKFNTQVGEYFKKYLPDHINVGVKPIE
jgi:hypothetical protein